MIKITCPHCDSDEITMSLDRNILREGEFVHDGTIDDIKINMVCRSSHCKPEHNFFIQFESLDKRTYMETYQISPVRVK